MSDHMLDGALEYAAYGWPVFPLHGKLPARPKNQGGNGFKDATTDADVVRRMWVTYPNANIGIRTGEQAQVAVLDIDEAGTDTLARIEADRDVLPGTVMQMTGSGGLHMLYKWQSGIKIGAAVWGPGLDLRGEGGYIVAAPSIHPKTGQRYEWQTDWRQPLPDWPHAQLPMPHVERPKPTAAAARQPTQGNCLAGLIRVILDAPEGQRNHVLNWAAYRAGEHIRNGKIAAEPTATALLNAALHIGLTERESVNTIASGLRAGGAT